MHPFSLRLAHFKITLLFCRIGCTIPLHPDPDCEAANTGPAVLPSAVFRLCLVCALPILPVLGAANRTCELQPHSCECTVLGRIRPIVSFCWGGGSCKDSAMRPRNLSVSSGSTLSMTIGVGCSMRTPKVLASTTCNRACTPTWSVPATTQASTLQAGARNPTSNQSLFRPRICVAPPISCTRAGARFFSQACFVTRHIAAHTHTCIVSSYPCASRRCQTSPSPTSS